MARKTMIHSPPFTSGRLPGTKPGQTFILLALLSVTGCSFFGVNLTPLQQVYESRQLYTATLNALSDARQAGLISDSAAMEIETARQAVAKELDAMEDAALGNNPIMFTGAKTAMNRALTVLLEWRVRAQRKE